MSLAIKRAMMKHLAKGGKVKRDPDVKGVHQTSYEDPGQSMAGMYARAAKEGVPGAGKMAKDEHKQVLSEIKNMKKPKLYAKGGMACPDCASGKCMAHGGFVKKEKASGYDAELVDRIMMSRGGQVANETEMSADFKDNQFDDLVLRDDLHSSYTGADSGDQLGNHQEDMDRHDIIARIMKSRAKKDRMPRPA